MRSIPSNPSSEVRSPAGDPAARPTPVARWLGYLYLTAAALGVLNLLVPAYPGFDVAGILAISTVASVSAAILLSRGGSRLPRWALQGFVAMGTALVCLAITFTQGVPNAGSMLYVWIALYAAYSFSRRAAVAHVVLIGVSYAVAIALHPPPFPPVAHWLTTVATLATAGLLVGVLRDRLHAMIGELGGTMVQRDQALARLEQLVRTDDLTGLPNRRAWNERLVDELGRSARTCEPLGLGIVDLDRFKALNDSEGHLAGDAVLRRLATRWPLAARECDFVARLGGDEFGVLLPGCDADTARRVFSRMRAAVPDVRWSAGLIVWDGRETADELSRRADKALYDAKSRGGGLAEVR